MDKISELIPGNMTYSHDVFVLMLSGHDRPQIPFQYIQNDNLFFLQVIL